MYLLYYIVYISFNGRDKGANSFCKKKNSTFEIQILTLKTRNLQIYFFYLNLVTLLVIGPICGSMSKEIIITENKRNEKWNSIPYHRR